jgi:hypothetical protein
MHHLQRTRAASIDAACFVRYADFVISVDVESAVWERFLNFSANGANQTMRLHYLPGGVLQ